MDESRAEFDSILDFLSSCSSQHKEFETNVVQLSSACEDLYFAIKVAEKKYRASGSNALDANAGSGQPRVNLPKM
ncbi:unnamed protein product, partial [Nesidiocoris tenuis]